MFFFSLQNIGHVSEESFKRMTRRVCNLDAVSGGWWNPGALPDKTPEAQTLCLAVLKVCKELAVLYTGINETLKSKDNL